jgi:hypothetical protein
VIILLASLLAHSNVSFRPSLTRVGKKGEIRSNEYGSIKLA